MSRYLLPLLMGLSVLAGGCERQEPPKVTPGDVERKAAEAAGAATDSARQEKEEYVARAQKAVDEARADIATWRAEAAKAGAGAKDRLQRQIDAMEARWKLAERKLGELRSASGEAWKDLRSGVDKAVEDLSRSRPSHRSS